MAAAAIKTHIADRLEMSIKDAALGIIEIACVKMAYAIREVTIEQGLDSERLHLDFLRWRRTNAHTVYRRNGWDSPGYCPLVAGHCAVGVC